MAKYAISDGIIIRVESDALYHHGIKGMRWGVRRYQNKDGSLTNAGQKRYSDDNGAKDKNESNGRHESVRKLARLADDFESKVRPLNDERDKLTDAWYKTNDKTTLEELDKKFAVLGTKRDKLWAATKKTDKELTKNIFESDDVKPAIENARQKKKELDELFDKYTGTDSDAYKQYAPKMAARLKQINPDWYTTESRIKSGVDEKWFYSDARYKAIKSYQKAAKKKTKEYDNAVINVGKAITEGMSDRGYDSWARTAAERYLDGYKVTKMFNEDL